MQEAQHEKSHGVSAESWPSHPLVCGFRKRNSNWKSRFKRKNKILWYHVSIQRTALSLYPELSVSSALGKISERVANSRAKILDLLATWKTPVQGAVELILLLVTTCPCAFLTLLVILPFCGA